MKKAEEILNTEMELYNSKGVNYLPLPEMFKVRFSDSEKEFIHKAMDIHAEQFKPKLIKQEEIQRLLISIHNIHPDDGEDIYYARDIIPIITQYHDALLNVLGMTRHYLKHIKDANEKDDARRESQSDFVEILESHLHKYGHLIE